MGDKGQEKYCLAMPPLGIIVTVAMGRDDQNCDLCHLDSCLDDIRSKVLPQDLSLFGRNAFEFGAGI